MTACLIALEGIHGAGKTTLARSLLGALNGDVNKIVFSRDQAGTPFSETIRNLNLDTSAVEVYTETFLVAAARRQTYVEVIGPSLAAQSSVITERFVDSFFAYGFARGLPLDFVQAVADATCGKRYPDLTLLLDLPPEFGLGRIPEKEKHRIELEGIDFHQKLRRGYLQRAQENSARSLIIDATQRVDKVQEDALSAIRSLLAH